jgi:hypothetical protein
VVVFGNKYGSYGIVELGNEVFGWFVGVYGLEGRWSGRGIYGERGYDIEICEVRIISCDIIFD